MNDPKALASALSDQRNAWNGGWNGGRVTGGPLYGQWVGQGPMQVHPPAFQGAAAHAQFNPGMFGLGSPVIQAGRLQQRPMTPQEVF